MHKKRPCYLISTIATVLWMNAGRAKIRDGAVDQHKAGKIAIRKIKKVLGTHNRAASVRAA